MHRWHFQKLFRWLIPALVFGVALCAVVLEQKASGGGLDFPDDAAYRNLAVARTVVDTQTYALQPGEAIPAVRDVLWRVLLALVGWSAGSYLTAAYLLGALFSLITVMLCLRMTRLLFPFPPFILYTSTLLIIAPGLLVGAVDGTPTAFAATLATAATLLHIEGLSNRRSPLPMLSAVLVGVLMWIRVEFGLLWAVFYLHAQLAALYGRRKDGTVGLVALRGITGSLILAMFVFPLVAWNLHVVRVPWPQAMGAPMTADALAALTPAAGFQQYRVLAAEGVRGAYRAFYATPFLMGVFERALVWFGAAFLGVLALWKKEEQAFGILPFLMIVLPALFGLVYPFAGWSPAPVVFAALSPLWIVAAAFGFFRIPFLVENLYRKWRQGLPEATGFNVWWTVMGSILIVVCLVRTGRMVHRQMARVAAERGLRERVVAAVRRLPSAGQPVVTDVPGWLAFAEQLKVVDVSGESTPEVLACLDASGSLDREKVAALLEERKPGSAVIWDSSNDVVLEALPCKALDYGATGDGGRPRVCEVTRSAAF